MYNGKTFLAIIPARSGSKGIKNKNIKMLNGKPLLSYTIKAALDSGIFDDIFVSTDSKEYAEIAIQYGASAPFLRPANIAGDNSLAKDYILHAIQSYKFIGKSFDYIAVLQPTSPLRTGVDIRNAVALLSDNSCDSVVSICQTDYSPLLCNVLPEDNSLYNFIPEKNNKNRQMLSIYYRINGAIYLINSDVYLNTKNFYGKKSKAYIMEKERSIDIDDELQFKFAEFLLEEISN